MDFISAAKESLFAGIAELIPGNKLRDIGASIEKYVIGKGIAVVKEYSGHGVGFSLHEAPRIPHFFHKSYVLSPLADEYLILT